MTFDLGRCLELIAIIEEEVGEARKEINDIWFGKKQLLTGFENEVIQIYSPLKELLIELDVWKKVLK